MYIVICHQIILLEIFLEHINTLGHKPKQHWQISLQNECDQPHLVRNKKKIDKTNTQLNLTKQPYLIN